MKTALSCALLTLCAVPALAAGADSAAVPLPLQQVLVLPAVGRSGRVPIASDPVEASIVQGKWKPPAAGDTVQLPDGKTAAWKAAAVGDNQTAAVLRGGYADVVVMLAQPENVIMDARADLLAYVNGTLQPGDVYANGTLPLPIHLRAGRNDLLFLCDSRSLQVKLTPSASPVTLSLADTTLPDVPAQGRGQVFGALPVLNDTNLVQSGMEIEASARGARSVYTPLPQMLPYSARKLMFRVNYPSQKADASLPVTLRLLQHGRLLGTVSLSLRVRGPYETCKKTFVSGIDGSVQYYAINPAHPLPGQKRLPALCLTLHGAGVEAIGQADAYESKSWLTFVAPTNRRPFGFDWEDWGRLDALEVLHIAQHTLPVDVKRTYLAGHSMGGHGTWQVGVLYPDRFAAIGPSAAWISFQYYLGMKPPAAPTPVQAMFERANNASNTLLMGHNYAQEGVYVLQGLADHTVPPNEAEFMVKYLAKFHHDFQYHFQPGAGHWWDVSKEPGADCVDWRPMYQFFAHHVLAPEASMRHLQFTTVNPGVTARDYWMTLEELHHAMLPGSADIVFDPGQRLFHGTTHNLACLSINLTRLLQPGADVRIKLDDDKTVVAHWPASGRLWLQHTGNTWLATPPLSSRFKTPQRSGPFKLAFNHDFCLVYGTHGTPAENAWARHKARYDAETFWYRGNGSVKVMPDTSFQAGKNPNRSVILYGNADTNSAWPALLSGSPVQVTENQVKAGAHLFAGTNLACLFLRPRAGSATACVGVVGGTGLAGMRLTSRLPIFVSGLAWPDCTVLNTSVLTEGETGVLMAGFFGNNWSIGQGEFAYSSAK